MCLQIKIFYSETRAAKVCLPFVGHLMRNRKDMNRISFLNRGYAFKGLLAVSKVRWVQLLVCKTCLLRYLKIIKKEKEK